MAQIGARSAGKPCSRKRMISSHFFVQAQKSREKISPQIFSFGKSLRRVFYSLRPFRGTVSRGRARAAPLPTHLLRICAGALKRRALCAVSKFASGKEPTSSRQGGLVCGALRLPHDLIRLPLLFPQNSPCDFCGIPESQESTCSPLKKAPIIRCEKEKDPQQNGSF